MHVKPEKSSNIGLFRAARVGGTGVSSGSGTGTPDADPLDWAPENKMWTARTSPGESQLWPSCYVEIADEDHLDLENLVKLDPLDTDSATFYTFEVYETLGCIRSAVAGNEIREMTSDYLDADLEALTEMGLEYGYGGPGLVNATDVSASSPPPFVNAVAHLLREWRRAGAAHRLPIIHAPLEFAAIAASTRLVNPQGGTVGAGGAARFAFGGYGVPIGAGGTPADGDPGSPSAAPNGWIYITGPVEIHLGDPREAAPETLASKRMNRADVLMEQPVTYRYDDSIVLAMEAAATVA